MFGKSWKRSVLSLGILCLIAISGLCYLSFDSRQKSKEPVKIYRVTEPAKKEASSDATTSPSVKNDTLSHLNYQKGVETAQPDPSTKSVSIPSVDPNTPSGESDQQESDLKTSQQNNEKLAKEEPERKKAEIQRLNAEARERNNAFRNVLERANRVKKDVEQRYYKVADKLNALSAEEQQAYFEDYRRGQPAAEEFIRSVFVEKAKTEAAAQGYSEQMEVLLNQMEQEVLGTTHEQRVKQHIEKLREYGFEPKF